MTDATPLQPVSHTPGPWLIIPSDRPGHVHQIAAPDGHRFIGVGGPDNWDEQTANARLVAAAPEMIDALREILQHVAPLIQDGDPLGMDIRRIAQHAIDRAATHTTNRYQVVRSHFGTAWRIVDTHTMYGEYPREVAYYEGHTEADTDCAQMNLTEAN